MSLDLDQRQRAMLAEMGIQHWWPQHDATAPADATAPQRPAGAAPGRAATAQATAPAASPASAAAPARAPALTRPTSAAPAAMPAPSNAPVRPPAAPAPAQASGASWHVGQAQPVAGAGDPGAERGPRWLLLSEGRPEDLGEDAVQLLRNMLRAARLHQGAQVWLAALQRHPGPAEVQGLDTVLERTEPDVVFIMGRLGAQALLETDQPLGRLRGQVHDLWGLPAIVSYDLGALLRTPLEKAKAWDDLCLALQVAQAQHAERLAAE